MEDRFDVSLWSDLFPPTGLSQITRAVKSCTGGSARVANGFILIAMVACCRAVKPSAHRMGYPFRNRPGAAHRPCHHPGD